MTELSSRRGSGELSDRIIDAVRTAGDWRTVREIHAELDSERSIAYTTVLTVMQRLAQKGVLDHERQGRSGRYRIAVNADPHGARTLVDQALSRFGSVAIAQFVERTREDPELLRELRQRLEADDAN